jgi:hypothetical protein
MHPKDASGWGDLSAPDVRRIRIDSFTPSRRFAPTFPLQGKV